MTRILNSDSRNMTPFVTLPPAQPAKYYVLTLRIYLRVILDKNTKYDQNDPRQRWAYQR